MVVVGEVVVENVWTGRRRRRKRKCDIIFGNLLLEFLLFPAVFF